MDRKSIMIDMDEVIVNHRFNDFLDEFLGGVDMSALKSYYRQDLIKGREKEFIKDFAKRNLYQYENGEFVKPFEACVETIQKLNEKYDVYIVTAYYWKEEVMDSALNLKNKFEYLRHFLPFMDPNHFVFSADKTRMHFDIAIDDRVKNLLNSDTRLLFTEARNEKITKEELDKNNIRRVDNWQEIGKLLLES